LQVLLGATKTQAATAKNPLIRSREGRLKRTQSQEGFVGYVTLERNISYKTKDGTRISREPDKNDRRIA